MTATSMDDHSSGSAQLQVTACKPPAVSSAPAAAAAMLHDSADSEDIVIDLEDSDDNDAPRSHLPPVRGIAFCSAQQRSTAEQELVRGARGHAGAVLLYLTCIAVTGGLSSRRLSLWK